MKGLVFKRIFFGSAVLLSFNLSSQSYPKWGSWWQQPIDQGYGQEARNPYDPVPAEDQVQQREIDGTIQQRSVEDRLQQRGVDAAIQQRDVDNLIQQRPVDETIQQGTGPFP